MSIALKMATTTSGKEERCMLLLMPLFRLSYLLLFIRFPSVAYQECRRSNTLHNEDIRTNFFSSCSLMYQEISLHILRHYLVVDSENKKREVITTFLLSFSLSLSL
jgi:hypothetical protein